MGILGEIFDWVYTKIVEVLSDLFTMIDGLGVKLFEYDWIKGIIQFFNNLGWTLFVVGLVVAGFELVIEMQNGKGTFKDIFMNVIKGFMATSLFTVLPIKMYELAVTLQGSLSSDIIGLYESETIGTLGVGVITGLGTALTSYLVAPSVLILIFFVVIIGYAMIKVFFSNLKRGGILLILMCVGSLYMFSVPRGYTDGFIGWCKQVIGICLTAFLQTLILTAGLLTINTNVLLGVGLMLSATEAPRVAGSFGLDTASNSNLGSHMYAVNNAVSLTKSIAGKLGKGSE